MVQNNQYTKTCPDCGSKLQYVDEDEDTIAHYECSNMNCKYTEDANICCLCYKGFEGFGNNPAPLKFTGVCCDKCNDYVIAARLRKMNNTECIVLDRSNR